MRLARSERERLWKGLERFVNCGDSEIDYHDLGRAFPDFWPVEIWHYPNYNPPAPPPILGRIIAPLTPDLSDEEQRKQWEHEGKTEKLNWHAACRRLFFFYRDTLREVWLGEPKASRSVEDLISPTHMGWLAGGAYEFLLGITDHNEEARETTKNREFTLDLIRPLALDSAWQEILNKFPTASVEGRVRIGVLWWIGDFCLVPNNDFQRTFYLLLRQTWRARVCPRCKMFFIARKPKQIFCGTGCSAGSRLASKRKWWRKKGALKRTAQLKTMRLGVKKQRGGRKAR